MGNRLEKVEEISTQLKDKYQQMKELQEKLSELNREVTSLENEKIKNTILGNIESGNLPTPIIGQEVDDELIEEGDSLSEERLSHLTSMCYEYGEEYILPMGEEEIPTVDDPDNWYGNSVYTGIIVNVNGTYIVDGTYKFDSIDALKQWAKVQYPEFMSDKANIIKLETLNNISVQQLEDMFDGKEISKDTISRRQRFEEALLRDDVIDFFLEKSPEEIEALFGTEVATMVGFDQNNPHHCYDLFEHTLNTVDGIDTEGLAPEDAIKLKVAAFLHDVGKPQVAMNKGDKTVFYNHAKKSAEISDAILGALDYEPEEIAQIKFFIEHHDDFINFKKDDEEWNRNNRFLRGINLQTVARKIQETKEDISIYGGYNPSKKDYQMLLRLCKADANAQSRIVREFGKVTDSRANKISRLSQVEDLVPEAYEVALENTAEAIKGMSKFGPKIEAVVDKHISDKVTHSMPGLFGDGRKKVVIDEDIKQYEQELREAYLRDGGPSGEALKSKTAELFAKGMTDEQFRRVSKILADENSNRMIGGIDEIHKGGRLTKLFDVKKSLRAKNLDADKLLQQYEDRLRREGISQDK